jgi:ribA/ribD-fused uncharacterized protein
MIKYKSDIFGATVYPDEKIIAFWGGILSQWAPCMFTCEKYLPGIELNSAEQGMMLLKAKEFNDTEIFDAILKSNDPREQKALGRKVSGFVPEQWDKVCVDYVTAINIDKFEQNYAWKEALKLVPDFTFVEASPYDRVWGVGLGEDNPDVVDPSKWDGKNYLGIAIMRARDAIIERSAINNHE